LFTGFGVEPDPDHAKCKLFLQHTLEVIAGGNRDHYEYLLDWLAWQVTDISVNRPGVAVVLKTRRKVLASHCGPDMSASCGVMGTFRSVAVNMFLSDSILQLRGKRLLFLDEAFYGGDKRHRGSLYTL
jgi:hypothetical protein